MSTRWLWVRLFVLSRITKHYCYQGWKNCEISLICFPGDPIVVAGGMVIEIVSVSGRLLNMDQKNVLVEL